MIIIPIFYGYLFGNIPYFQTNPYGWWDDGMPLSIFNDPLLEPSTRWTIGPQVIFPAIRTSITVSPETFGELCDFCEKHKPTLRLFKRGTFHQGKWMEVEHPFFSKPCLNMMIIMIKELNGPCQKKHELCSITRSVVFFIGPRPVHAGS